MTKSTEQLLIWGGLAAVVGYILYQKSQNSNMGGPNFGINNPNSWCNCPPAASSQSG